jgi:hypothetical protein
MGTYTAVVTATNSVSAMTATTEVEIMLSGELSGEIASPLLCAGWNVAIDITYKNLGLDPPADATLVVTVPQAAQVVHAQSSAGLMDPGPWPGTVAWDLGWLPKGASVTYRLSLHLPSTLAHGTVLVVPMAAHALGGTPIQDVVTLTVRTDGLCQSQPPEPTATPTATPAETPTGQQSIKLMADDDTTLDASAPTTVLNELGFLTVNGTGSKRALVRFDLSAIPAGAAIGEAWLDLVTYAGGSLTDPLEIRAYDVLVSWWAEEATWLEARRGMPWAEPGGDGTGIDRAAAPCAEAEIVNRYNVRYSWDVTERARGWLADPAGNQGLLLVGPGGAVGRFNFWSSEADVPNAMKPHLRVSYVYDGPTATATPTVTPTATTTPTVTRTPKPSATSAPAGSDATEGIWLPLIGKQSSP